MTRDVFSRRKKAMRRLWGFTGLLVFARCVILAASKNEEIL